MGELSVAPGRQPAPPFNGEIEVGLRALSVLTCAYPEGYSVGRLTALDYLLVHSADAMDGPPSLHPPTPFRGGEVLVRRGVLQDGLALFWGRGLIERRFNSDGVYWAAGEHSAAFLDALQTPYVAALRERAGWAVAEFGEQSDEELAGLVRDNVGEWGAEFTRQSVLREEKLG